MESDKDDPHMPTINAVVQQITQELKQILKKDFNKKMIENTAFKKFETWWEDESTKENKNIIGTNDKLTSKQKDNLNILLEVNRESLYSNINLENLGLGLGLRASLPKMPSFRKKKIPSPVQEDEDSRKLSDNEEIVHDSDSEVRPLQRVRKVSTSSSSSSDSTDDSSESDSSSSDESSSDSEEVIMNDGIEATNKTPEPMQIDDNDSQVVATVSQATIKKTIDSDVSEDEREYLERRRRNTEWMEQIERERKQQEKVEESEKAAIDVLMEMATVAKKSNSDEEDLNGSTVVVVPTTVESESGGSSPSTHVVMEHSYCMPPEQENMPIVEVTKESFTHDHIYTTSKVEEEEEEEPQPPQQQQQQSTPPPPPPPTIEKQTKPPRQRNKQKHNNRKLQEIQNIAVYEERYTQAKSHDMKHRERDMVAEMGILYEFLTKGIDQEDINYMRQSYEAMLADDSIGYWLNDTHWVDHCITDLYSSPAKRRKKEEGLRVHATGCARTEGFYKIEAYEKAKYKHHHAKVHANSAPDIPVTKMQGGL